MSDKLFGDLYEYSGTDGKMTVIPDFPTIRQKVADGFQRIFTSDFVTDPETPNGLLIDAISTLFFDALGVTAQNANGMNVNISAGQLLDAIGKIFGIQRQEGEGDNSYRQQILESQARGNGTVQSVRQALSNNANVKRFCVLENIENYPIALPENSEAAISIDPHSILVCVKMFSDSKIDTVIEDVLNTKSIGCGCSRAYDIPTGHEHTSEGIRVYTAVDKTDVYVSVTYSLETGYSGQNPVAEIKASIESYISDNSICRVINSDSIKNAIFEMTNGIVPVSVKFYDTSSFSGEAYDKVVVRPYEYVVFDDSHMKVEEA